MKWLFLPKIHNGSGEVVKCWVFGCRRSAATIANQCSNFGQLCECFVLYAIRLR